MSGVRETRVAAEGGSLYVREVGSGTPLLVLHGGPDFDSGYLVPELDRWAERFRVVYYDQRGRGRSAEGIRPDEVTLASEIADLDRVRQHVGAAAPILVGHSWGTVLALAYALRHPTRVGRLVLMNPAPASADDRELMRASYRALLGDDRERQAQLMAGEAYRSGDPEAVTARYRLHFRAALRRRADHERLMDRMRTGFVRQGPGGILLARAVEDQLMRETWDDPGWNLLPALRQLPVPALVITGDHDFIPIEVAAHITQALPAARLVTVEDCGHFAFLERPDEVGHAVTTFCSPGQEPTYT